MEWRAIEEGGEWSAIREVQVVIEGGAIREVQAMEERSGNALPCKQSQASFPHSVHKASTFSKPF